MRKENGYIARRFLGALLIALLLAGSAGAAGEVSLCQTGMVLVVPKGEPGARVTEFVTTRGAPARDATAAAVKWDDTALTIMFDCADTNLLAQHDQRDDLNTWRDDCVEVFLDLGHTHDDGAPPWVHIMLSASNGLYDARGGDPLHDQFEGGDASYNLPDLQHSVARTPGGWRATLTIPWKGLGHTPKVGDVWGFNLNRENHPEEEYSCWAPIRNGFVSNHEWGHLVFAPPAPADAEEVELKAREAIAGRHVEIPKILQTRADRYSAKLKRWEKAPLDPAVAELVEPKQRGHTIWRADWVRQARQNATNTVWGQAVAARIMAVADYWAAKSDRELLELIPVGNPRAMVPGTYHGDPLSGGNRKTLVTCLETPYRWYNPETKQWWYDGVTVTNPGTGKPLTVRDDGSGFVAPDGFPRPGMRTYFTAAYRGYLIGMLLASPYGGSAGPAQIPESSGNRYSGAIPRLAEAYALTGKPLYAHKAAVLLGRLAELYPYMNGHMGDYPRDVRGDRAVWLEKSCTDSEYLWPFLDAADLVWDGVDADMEKQLAEAFAAVSGPDGKQRREEFRWKPAVNAMLPYAAELCERMRQDAWADWAFRWIQAELAIAAATESPRLLAKILFGPSPALQGLLQANFYRDGRHSYDSAGYIKGLNRTFILLPFRSSGFQGGADFPEPLNLYEDPRFLLDEIMVYNLKTDTGALIPTFGDWEGERNPRPPSAWALAGYGYALDPVMEVPAAFSEKFRARYRASLSGAEKELDRLREQGGNFTTLVFARNWAETPGPTGQTPLASTLLEDSAVAYLRSGLTRATRHDLVIWGAPGGAHMQPTKLGIWFGGRGRNLAANGGAYPFTSTDPKLVEWEHHSAAGWVVLVDGRSQEISVSDPVAFYDGGLFRLAALVNTNAYPGSRQQRNVWLVPGAQDGDAYALDIFQVEGGGRVFDYNTRGNNAGHFDEIRFEFRDAAPQWEQHGGSLAGTNIPLYGAPGYGWMKDVRMLKTTGDFSWQYDYGGAGLKVHALSFGRPRTLIYALGEFGGFPRGKAPWDPHLLWRDEEAGGSNHVTQFVTVLESVGETPFIERIETLAGAEPASGLHPIGLKVRQKDGVTDVILINPQPGKKVGFIDTSGGRWETDAHTAMQRLDATGGVLRTELFHGTLFKAPQGDYACPASLEGQVEAVDYDKREIVVRLDAPVVSNLPPAALEGLVAIHYPAGGGRLTAYRLRNPALDGARLRFTSPLTLIHSPAPPAWTRYGDFSDRPAREIGGRKIIVDVVPGNRLRLPLAARYPSAGL